MLYMLQCDSLCSESAKGHVLEIFYIDVVMGKDLYPTVHIMVAYIDSTKLENEKWRGEIHLYRCVNFRILVFVWVIEKVRT